MSDDRLRELGKQLPWDRPDPERREAVRSSLLVAATEGDGGIAWRRWVLLGTAFAAGALAAAAVALVVVRGAHEAAPPPREAHAWIDAPATAKLEHTVIATATGTDELVRVRAGTVRLAVPAVRAGSRVLTRTGDAEVEGTGIYEVVVTADALARVTVDAGTARVKLHGVQQAVYLSAGQTWRATIVTADLELPAPAAHDPGAASPPPAVDPAVGAPGVRASAADSLAASSAPARDPATRASPLRTVAPELAAPARRATTRRGTAPPKPATPEPAPTAAAELPRMPAVTSLEPNVATAPPSVATAPPSVATAPPSVATAPPTPRPTPAPSATERHFKTGYALLREGKVRRAAIELGAAADAGGDDPLAIDARYFQAIALVRADQRADAERALLAFLDRARRSMRRGRAAVLLGRLLADRGDRSSAASWFESAVGDPDPSIAASARASLDALER